MKDQSRADGGHHMTGDRRSFLKMLGSTGAVGLVGGLAGCESLNQQFSFVADRVSLTADTAQRYAYGTPSRDAIPWGESLEISGVGVSVSILSRFVGYQRQATNGVVGENAGLGVLSTPVAEVLGQAVNPQASAELSGIINGAIGERMLEATGLDSGVAWTEGPTAVGQATPASLLGGNATVESYVGVADDGDRHLVFAHLVRRAVGEDMVFASAVTTEGLPANGGQISTNAIAASAGFKTSREDALGLFAGLVSGRDPGTASPESPGTGPARIFNRNIDETAHQQVHAMESEGIRVFAFHPDGGWVVITHQNNRFAQDIPDECYQELRDLAAQGQSIRWVAFPPAGGNRWSIVYDGGFSNRNVPDALHQKMVELQGQGHRIEQVAFPATGGNSWFLLTDQTTFARNIPDECWQVVRNIHEGPRRVHHVAFAPDGGWLVVADDYHFGRNVDGELFSKMNEYAGDSDLINLVAFDPDGRGWSVVSNGPASPVPFDPIRTFEGAVDGTSIWEAMRNANVPGVAVAVVRNNRLDWATGYGHAKADSDDAIHPESVFQAASISKPLAAIGAVRMARDGTLNLDADVNSMLSGWTLATQQGVTTSNTTTVRRLLSHSGGTNISGFNGYGVDGNGNRVSVPTLNQVLSGSGPSNSNLVQTVYDPGTSAVYSGGGYTVVQKSMADTSGRPFTDWMTTNVLEPAGMDDSTFDLSLGQSYVDDGLVTAGHDGNGAPIPGDRNQYPESAAAGLYSTVLDLAQVIRMLNGNGTVDGTEVLTQAETATVLAPQTFTDGTIVRDNGNRIRSLGFILRNLQNGPLRYHHGGTNAGFRCATVGYPTLGAGVVVMTNGSDPSLRWDVANAVIGTYGWE